MRHNDGKKLFYTMEEASEFFTQQKQNILNYFRMGVVPQGDLLEQAYLMELMDCMSISCNLYEDGLFLTSNQLDQMLEKATHIARNAIEEILSQEMSIIAGELLDDSYTFICDEHEQVVEIINEIMEDGDRSLSVEVKEDCYVITVTK